MWNLVQKRRNGIALALGVVALVLVSVALGWLGALWGWLEGRWSWLGEMNEGETNSATMRNFFLVPLALIGIGLTLWRIMVAQRQAEASEGNLQTARDALRHAEHKDEADRLQSSYADASRRLSSDSVSARLAAIYELQVLTAQDPELLHIRTMNLLCAFVRFPPSDTRLDEVPDDDPCSVSLRPDVQAAMEVIGSRTTERIKLETDADYMPDLRQANLVRLQLREGNLSKIDMKGSKFWGADLTEADLSASTLQYADFSSPWGVQRREPADMSDRTASVYQQALALLDDRTHLNGTNLYHARMYGAKLSGVILQGANLSRGVLIDANLASADLGEADFTEANLINADLSGAKLIGADSNAANPSSAGLGGSSGASPDEFLGERRPIGLTQAQLDQACADPNNPPKLDESSGLVWNPQPCPA